MAAGCKIGGFFMAATYKATPCVRVEVLRVGDQAQGLLAMVAVQRPTQAHAHRVGRVVVCAVSRTAHHAHPIGAQVVDPAIRLQTA